MPPKKEIQKVEPDRIRGFIFLVVVVVWVIAMMFDLYSENYQVPVEVTGLVGAILGYFTFSLKRIK